VLLNHFINILLCTHTVELVYSLFKICNPLGSDLTLAQKVSDPCIFSVNSFFLCLATIADLGKLISSLLHHEDRNCFDSVVELVNNVHSLSQFSSRSLGLSHSKHGSVVNFLVNNLVKFVLIEELGE